MILLVDIKYLDPKDLIVGFDVKVWNCKTTPMYTTFPQNHIVLNWRKYLTQLEKPDYEHGFKLECKPALRLRFWQECLRIRLDKRHHRGRINSNLLHSRITPLYCYTLLKLSFKCWEQPLCLEVRIVFDVLAKNSTIMTNSPAIGMLGHQPHNSQEVPKLNLHDLKRNMIISGLNYNSETEDTRKISLRCAYL